MRHLARTIAWLLLAFATADAARAGVWIEDTFDEVPGDLGNNSGTGPDWTHSTWRINRSEVTDADGSYFKLQWTGDYGNGGITSGPGTGTPNSLASGNVPVWNATGATFTWRTGLVAITQPAGGAASEFGHVFGVNHITQEDPDNEGIVYHNDRGSVAVEMRYDGDADGVDAVTGFVYVITSAKQDNDSSDLPDDGWQTVGRFTVAGYDGADWLTSNLFINNTGFEWLFDLDGPAAPAFAWSDLLTGAAATPIGFALAWDDYDTYGDTAGGTDPVKNPDGTSNEFGDGAKLIALGTGSGGGRGVAAYDLVRVEEGNALPEPATLTLLAIGAAAVASRRAL